MKMSLSQKKRTKLMGYRNGMSGTKWAWMKNNESGKRIYVRENEIQELLKHGWILLRDCERKIDESNPAHSRCWMNNGKESKFVLKSEKDIYIEQGWKVGRLTFTT